MKKRLVLSLLSILLVSLLFSPDTFSQETPVTVVRVAPHPLSPYYDLHSVDIVIENGQAVTGYQVMLQYDSDYIQYVSIDHGNYLPDGAFFGDAQIRDTDPNDSLKAILFAAGTSPNQSEGDGVLATLTFKTKRDEPSDLTLLDVTLLSHGVVDDKVVLSSPQLENSRTHGVIESSDIEKIVQATYSHEGVFLFLDDLETAVVTLEEMVRRGESGPRYDLDGDGKITSTDLAWMRFAVRLDVNNDEKIDTQDKEDVKAAIGKTGSRPEDVNGDEVVSRDDEFLVNTAILAVENLSRLWSNLPVEKVVQATYSHEGVFLFLDDPETAVVTLEEMVRRGESGPRYDLDGDGKITSTDLAWMRFAVRLDVNGDEKIDWQDEKAVKAAIGKTGSRPEDVNGDRVVSRDDEFLVNTAILAIKNLSLLHNVRRVVQATYSYEGVFLFGEDPETAVVTLEEMVRRHESGSRYDLDGDGKITSTDLAWMHFAVRLDVNGDGKINTQDESAVKAASGKTGNQPEDVNSDGFVDIQDIILVVRAIREVYRFARPVVQVIWYHPSDVQAYTSSNNPLNWAVNIDSMPQILEDVRTFYSKQIYIHTKELVNFNFEFDKQSHVIPSHLPHASLVSRASDFDFFKNTVFNDLKVKWQKRGKMDMSKTQDIYLVVVQSDARKVGSASGSAFKMFGSKRRRFSIVSTGNTGYGIASWEWEEVEKKDPDGMAQLIAHELGHNFELMHKFEKDHIMGYCRANKLNANAFTDPCETDWLRLHPAFNDPMVRGSQDAVFDFVDYNPNNQTLEIQVTTQNGDPDLSVSQFIFEDPPKANRNCKESEIGKYEIVQMWKGTAPVVISYDSWLNGRSTDETYVFIRTIDAHGHITQYGGYPLQQLISLAPTAAPAPLHVSLLPERTGLLPNYPNPFNPETWIPYQLANPTDVALTIYDIQGRVVRDLDLGHQRAGTYHSRARAAYWDGRNSVGEPVASGVYFYTLKAGDFAATRKMLIRK